MVVVASVSACDYRSVDVERMRVIPLESFEEHCKNYHQLRDAGFETEYEVNY